MNVEHAECYTRKVNEKMDVYSFGVVLLELTTGREANDGGDDGSLADWAWQHVQDGNQLIDAIDCEIKDHAFMQEIEMVFKLGILCTNKTPSMRPTMKEVLQVLLQFHQIEVVHRLHKMDYGVAPGCLQTKRGSRHNRISDSNEFDDYCTSPV